MSEPIYQRVTAEVKVAMKARDKARLGALRLILADFKRIEVDERSVWRPPVKQGTIFTNKRLPRCAILTCALHTVKCFA